MGEGHPCTTPTAFSCFSSVTTMVGPIKRGDGGGGGGGSRYGFSLAATTSNEVNKWVWWISGHG